MWFPSHGVASKVIFFMKKRGAGRGTLGFSAASFFNFETEIKLQTLDIPNTSREGVFVVFCLVCFPGSKNIFVRRCLDVKK